MKVTTTILVIISFLISLYLILNKNTKLQLPKNILNKHNFGNKYIVYEIESILNDTECKTLILHASPKLIRSGTISKDSISNHRTSYNTFLRNNEDDINIKPILDKIDYITHKLSGKPYENQEPLQVVKYTKGQEYKEHYDCCVPLDNAMCIQDNEKHGFRHSTLLIYLNEVEKGGETDFPLLKHKFTPKLGKAIYFFNLNKNETSYHKLSKHAGLPPLGEGEKWVCNKWIRTKKYTY
jgi:prolyl 4-hydroxylase